MGKAAHATDGFCRTIGYEFSNKSLLIRALTHASADKSIDTGTYERLEFLGDRVLGLVVSDFLMCKYPAEDEGQLSRRLSLLVDRSTLVSVSKKIQLQDYIIYGGGTKLNESIQADVMEAIFGAIYLDGGLENSKKVIETLLCTLADKVKTPPIDSKTALQEWAQSKKLQLPMYKEIGREGPDHKPIFIIEVSVDGCDTITAKGPSKRVAEQAAAKELLFSIISNRNG